jgi:hypothetical protein
MEKCSNFTLVLLHNSNKNSLFCLNYFKPEMSTKFEYISLFLALTFFLSQFDQANATCANQCNSTTNGTSAVCYGVAQSCLDLFCNKTAAYWFLQPNTLNFSLGNYLSPTNTQNYPIDPDPSLIFYSVCRIQSLSWLDSGPFAFQAIGFSNTGVCNFDVYTYGNMTLR